MQSLHANFIAVIGVYDKQVQRFKVPVKIVEAIADSDQVEIICPDVIHPGDYFRCHIDIPFGTGLTGNITMTDDLNGDVDATADLKYPGK